MATIADYEAARQEVDRAQAALDNAKARLTELWTDGDLAQELANKGFHGGDSEGRLVESDRAGVLPQA